VSLAFCEDKLLQLRRVNESRFFRGAGLQSD